jgi:two-component system invasion response regulator UvrY
MVNVFIADDHALIREGLKKTLKAEPDLVVAGEASNALGLFQALRQNPVDIVLLDISMPGESGLDALKEIKQEYPRLPVLILSVHPEHRFAVRALKAGAAGYVTKDTAVEELVQAIRKIVGGGKYVSVSLAEKLVEELETGDKLPHETLSDREFQVMRMLAAGKTRNEIADELSISLSTVNTYRIRIMEKMKVQTNADLTRYAIEHGLIE